MHELNTNLTTERLVPLIPESAPFNTEQRAWLNGFLAGYFSNEVVPETAQPAVATSGQVPEPEAAPIEEDFPWHDPGLEVEERLALADDRPLERRLMAAMAQLDCGQCGYVCQTYAEAIANGSESKLTLCSPGGKTTNRQLKKLLAESDAPSANGDGSPGATSTASETNGQDKAGYDRNHPVSGRLLESRRLNHPESDKETRFISIDLSESGLTFEVGDSLGIFPKNCPDLIGELLGELGASGEETVGNNGSSKTLAELLSHADFGAPSDESLQLLAECATDAEEHAYLHRCLEDGTDDGDDIVDVLRRVPSAKPDPASFALTLEQLQPRLYSISSSQKEHPGQVQLTVAVVRYERNERRRKGVASTFLSERLEPGTPIDVYVQRSHGFRLPGADVPVIMIGPGTGIAPFRAFLQERKASGAKGKNWLFFGDWRREHDFLYEDEFSCYLTDGHLTNLDLAFSRDQAEKIYVQHLMRERGKDLWEWLQEGAHLYVCGDAKRMARDVDKALKEVATTHGGVDGDQYVKELSAAGRYLKDVY
ncbi:Sulfite reductase [NADPH] flavoprotein alpha-component [Planctomycetes bacterium Pan216]|uniref:assimilatory sulfite reductase (NADPH) n=1 Tax=Kolteria novifilia TaxID=2527975 RepID=A0A518B0J4_9BACT|nr:Sulfite reductase [NADPH] flavoprotein alpha-component [Planctomycetes bacterium Pan216]